MDKLVANRLWVHRENPFPHVIASDVFVREFYDDLVADFRRVMNSTAAHGAMPGYDAKIVVLAEHAHGALAVFLSRAWHDLLAGVVGATTTGDVAVALHRHPPGGRAGWPHNDLNPGWFGGEPPAPDEVRAEGVDGVHYKSGEPDGKGRENVRSVAVLYYLANPDWSSGDGGETGLYASGQAHHNNGVVVPPVNNSLVMFECTPYSWHGYLGNSRHERNSLAMWLHRPKQAVIDTWGEDAIAYW